MLKTFKRRLQTQGSRILVRVRRKRVLIPLAIVLAASIPVVVTQWDRGRNFLASLPGTDAIVSADVPTHRGDLTGVDSPLSVAVGLDNSVLYVAEGSGERLVKQLSIADGQVIGVLFPPRTSPGTRNPISVAVGADGIVYVVDRARGAVDLYGRDGVWLGVLTPPPAAVDWQPLGVDIAADGSVYVTNTGPTGPVVVVFAAGGAVSADVPLLTADGLVASFPTGVVVDGAGRLIVADSNNSRLLVLRLGESTSVAVGTSAATHQFGLPRGLAYDGDTTVLVADATDHTISGWDVAANPPRFLFQFGEEGIGDGAFLFPNDVAVGPDGDIFVADRDNNRIQIWAP